MKNKILVIEDDRAISELLCMNLEAAGYETVAAYDGEEAQRLLLWQEDADLAVVDIMLPGKDGFALMEDFKKKELPVLYLTAKDDVASKVKGLKLGAEDYMVKPFDSNELVARVQAILRRVTQKEDSYNTVPAEEQGECVKYDGLTVNLTGYSVIYNGNMVEMPPKELELLYFLASSPNQVFTREQLLDKIWGYDYIGDTRTVDVHVKRVREKIKDGSNWSIATVWGIGYKFEVK